MSSFILKQLDIHTFRSFRTSTTVFFSEGINLIVGPGGSGKTNILTAIDWALNGQKSMSHSKNDLSPFGSDDPPNVELMFEDEVGHEYTIHRIGSGVTLTLDGEVLAKTTTGVESYLKEHFGVSRETYNATKYVKQGELADLASGDAKSRTKVIETLQGTTGLLKLDKMIFDDAKKIQEELDLSSLEDLWVAKANLKSEIKNLANGQENAAAAEACLATADSELQEHRATGEELIKLHAQIQENVARQKAIQTTLQLLDCSDENPATQVYTEFQRKYPKVDPENIDQAINSAAESCDNLKTIIVQCDNRERELQAQIHSREAQREGLMLEVRPAEPDPDREDLGRIEKERDTLERTLDKMHYDLTALYDELQNIQEDGSVCSRCGSELNEEHHQRILEDYDRQKTIYDAHMLALTSKNTTLQRLEMVATAWAEYAQYAALNVQRKKSNLKIDTDVQAWKVALEELVHEKVEAMQSRQDVETTLRDLTKFRNEILVAKTKLDAWNQKKDKAHALLTECARLEEELPRDYQEVLQAYEKYSEELGRLQAEVSRLTALRDQWQAYVLNTESTKARLEGTVARLEALTKNQTDNKLRLDALQKLRKSLKRFIPHYQSLTMPLLQSLFAPLAGSFCQEFKGFQLSPTYDISALRYGQVTTFENFSGSQRDGASLALRLALARIETVHSSASLDFMILDEPTASYDQKRTDVFCEALETLQGFVRQLIIVTHNHSMKDVSETIVEVSISGEGSVCV